MSGDYSSISVDGLNDLIAAMMSGNRKLSSGLATLRSRMQDESVSTQVFTGIDTIAEWIDLQIPGLERRRNMVIALLGDEPTSTQIRIDEPIPFDSPEEAEQHGRDMAAPFLESGVFDEEYFDSLMADFEPYMNDPDVMAGFYLALGPELAERLPDMLYQSGTDDGARYVEQFSVGLAAAMNADNVLGHSSDYRDEFKGFREHFMEPTEHPSMAWGRLALLQFGDFDGWWVAHVARNNVLETFEGEEGEFTDFRHSIIPEMLGLPTDTAALAFNVLGNNPQAARFALDSWSDLSLEEYADRVYGMQQSLGTGDDIAEGFGQALVAGSGASEDPPDKGMFASEFAFTTILALGRFDDTPWPMREPMSQIATAYAEELLVGSFTLDARARESSMDAPDNFDLPPGLDPAFYLSPEATYRFLHGFAHEDRYFEGFDAAVEELYESVTSDALAADLQATENDERDPGYFERAMNMFGTLAGLQYQAAHDVRGNMDAQEEQRRAFLQRTLSELLTLSPTPPIPGKKVLVDYGWKLTKITVGRLTKSWANESGGRVDELEMEMYQGRLLYDYMIADTLLQNGYPHTEPIPPNLVNDSGDGLRDPAEIADDPDLWTEFYEWVDSNQEGWDERPHRPPFDEKFEDAMAHLDSGDGNRADGIAGETDWDSSVR
ncbi:hypothetical protein [Phytoactinopolyspora halotolerans]|uniref:Uncharacterized protein n=1 Tax=Phytoactinopolyspora halotolerans TaxID=1981512 RepID=A0A6L9SCY7_9ACTN|nr:hypothetical protein [Phytoactinopolyspora halotolerans]NEE02879.1 hypothetical protein [Phytoactinopolyspora halotolerans]